MWTAGSPRACSRRSLGLARRRAVCKARTIADESHSFDSLPAAVRVQLATGGPLLLGLVAGFLLGETAAGYWVVTAIAILGGVAAGAEHDDARAGAIRGLVGGLLFGLGLWVAHVVSADPELVHLPSPTVLIVVITTIAGVGLGALGGWLRSRQGASTAS